MQGWRIAKAFGAHMATIYVRKQTVISGLPQMFKTWSSVPELALFTRISEDLRDAFLVKHRRFCLDGIGLWFK